MMIKLISRPNIDQFSKLVPGLERVLTKTSLGKYWSIEALYDNIVNFSAYGFYQEESGFSGAFTVSKAPLQNTLNVFWAGKDPSSTTPINHTECDEFYQACAQYFECKTILVQGRRGWEKIGKKFGYSEDSRVYLKEV
jgi:hypothetical protein